MVFKSMVRYREDWRYGQSEFTGLFFPTFFLSSPTFRAHRLIVKNRFDAFHGHTSKSKQIYDKSVGHRWRLFLRKYGSIIRYTILMNKISNDMAKNKGDVGFLDQSVFVCFFLFCFVFLFFFCSTARFITRCLTQFLFIKLDPLLSSPGRAELQT